MQSPLKPLSFLAIVGAVAACVTMLLGPPPAQGSPPVAGVDPLFAPFAPLALFDKAAICSSRGGAVPPVLNALMLAQAPRSETAPFTPGQQSSKAGPAPKAMAVPLYKGLGTLHVPISTTNAKAQAYFNQGIRLTFAFNHAEAARAFRTAQAADPSCAMCFWGEALVLGPNINAPMFPEANAPAFAAATRATGLAARATPMEQALIRAVARRYVGTHSVATPGVATPGVATPGVATPGADRSALDKAYADAMTEAARSFPNDDTVQVLFAEALMDLAPWDYWEAGGARPKNRTAEMVDVLERVLERQPTHPGAAHYYIHAMEASTQADKTLPYARMLAQQMPGAGHVVHMPSHIYYRVGMYKEALRANQDAIAADERYFQQSPSDPVYMGAYYPHNIHFLMVSALMGGDGKTALDAATKLDKAVTPDMLRAIGAAQPVKAAPYFSHVQFSSPDTLVALPDPGNEFVLVKAMWHYARATGAIRKGDYASARTDLDALAAIERNGNFTPLTQWAVPGREIVQTARAVVSGRLADARGDLPAAIRSFSEAVKLQDGLPYMEPPYWYYPVRQSLGVALMRSNRLDEAEQVFRTSLVRTPSNGWALRGLIEVYRQRGDAAALAAAEKRFKSTWLGKAGGPALSAL